MSNNKLTRTTGSGTSSGASSVVTTPTASSFVRPDAATHVQDSYPSARVVFDFTPTSPFELAVSGKVSFVSQPKITECLRFSSKPLRGNNGSRAWGWWWLRLGESCRWPRRERASPCLLRRIYWRNRRATIDPCQFATYSRRWKIWYVIKSSCSVRNWNRHMQYEVCMIIKHKALMN